MLGVLKRQLPVFLATVVAAFAAVDTATADPSVSAKRAQAERVMAQIQESGSRLERARNIYLTAARKLQHIERSLTINTIALRAARANLRTSQKALMQRLVVIYTTQDDQSTMSVLLGATSIDDLVNRVEAVQSVSRQDVAIVQEVVGFKRAVATHRRTLQRAHASQVRLVRQRAAAKEDISGQLARQQRLLASIRGEIASLLQAQERRQLLLARTARARYTETQRRQAALLEQTPIGASAADGSSSVAPPSQYGGVVGIAMRYLGVPYVWGGSTPSGFDCSGFTMYVYAQMGVSLPHYTGAQWNMGVPVARSDLQAGDLVFFDGLGHMGIYMGGGQFIHAPHSGDVVKISSLSGWYEATYVGARRITG